MAEQGFELEPGDFIAPASYHAMLHATKELLVHLSHFTGGNTEAQN